MAMDLFWAFLVGGALCAVGQVLIDYTKLTPARILTAYVVAGVALSAVGIYPKLVELAGGGASVPLTGFGNLLAEGVRESVDENGLLGIFMGGLMELRRIFWGQCWKRRQTCHWTSCTGSRSSSRWA